MTFVAKVDPDMTLLGRLEAVMKRHHLGLTALASTLGVPLITLRRFRKSGRALESTRHRISDGLRPMEKIDSKAAVEDKQPIGRSDALRSEVIAALELLLDAARSAAHREDVR